MIDSYDLIEWVTDFQRVVEVERGKLNDANQKLAKHFKTIEVLTTRQRQQEMLNKLVLSRDQLRLCEKTNRLFSEKLKELRKEFNRYYFNPHSFVEKNDITSKDKLFSYVKKVVRETNHAHFKACDELAVKMKQAA